jgi:2-hydroxychromene-2-carboxylate isomerase
MPKIVDYYFSPVSPWTYFGQERLVAMAKKHGAEIRYKPADYGKIFAAAGGLPVAQRPKQRQAYRLQELERWRSFLGMKLNIQPKFFPASNELAARVIIAARQAGRDPGPLAFAIMRACWAEERNIADEATLAAICGEQGLDGKALLAAAKAPATAEEYAANTAEAIERQVFGAPWYLYAGESFWGQDRLDFLERALGR